MGEQNPVPVSCFDILILIDESMKVLPSITLNAADSHDT